MANAWELKRRIEAAIRRYAQASSPRAYSLVPNSLTSGKLYEAQVLSVVLKRLHEDEDFRIVLMNSTFIPLKSAPGPINPRYPHFDLFQHGTKVAELWTDIEFLALSYDRSGGSAPPSPGDYHELDIVVIDPGLSGRPPHQTIWLGVECKNTGYTKNLLKGILGIRRELSLLDHRHPTHFSKWPRQMVPANPPSCLVVYSTDPAVLNYASPGEVFGIDFFHETI
jgi:hypothetical protein